jgi:hypothetical protein
MTRQRSLLPSALLTALLCVGTVVAQNGGVGDGGEVKGEGTTKKPANKIPKPEYVYRSKGIVEITFHADETQTERIVPPAEIRALRAKNLIPKIHASKLFEASVSTRPRQLAPGESGTLHVLVMLANDAVVLPGSKVSLEVFKDTLPISLGESSVVPASKGTLPGHFRGTLVHDNIVEIRTPITINADAVAKSYPIPGHVEIESHSGKTGQLVGVFYCGINGWLKVGRSLAAPEIPRTNGKGESGPNGKGTGNRTPDVGTKGVAPGPGRSRKGDPDNDVTTQETGPNPSGGDEVGSASEETAPFMSTTVLLGACIVVALGLILTLLGRSKR